MRVSSLLRRRDAAIGETTGYSAGRVSPLTLGFVVAAHAAAVAAALSYNLQAERAVPPPPLIVQTLDLTPPPPPPAQAEAAPPTAPEIYAPTPRFVLPQPPPPMPVTVVPDVPPAVAAAPQPQPAPTPAPPRPPAPPAPVQVAGGDLSSTMIEGNPPRYPIESRRKREQGTVVLALVLGTDGKVSDIRVTQSSGHSRLDAAALSAVRKWRWSPTLRDGTPVLVRGTVEIPFVLVG